MPAWLTAKVIAFIAIAVFVVGLLLWGPAACDKIRSLTAQSKVDKGQSGAFTNSAGDAIETIGNASDRERASDDLTRDNSRDIHAAPGADTKVPQPVNQAGRNALCKRAAYKNRPECKGQTP